MRLRSKRIIANHRPFATDGFCLYVGADVSDPGPQSVVFRRVRMLGNGNRFLQGSGFDFGGRGIVKTSAVATIADPAHQFTCDLAAYAGQHVYLQVRRHEASVENESNYQPYHIRLDESVLDVTGIAGTATLLSTQIRDGGVVRLRFSWLPAATGLQPTEFTAQRTAGPSTPVDVTVPWSPTVNIIEIDTPALLDSAPYTYQITATSGSTTVVILSGITFTADATGPAAPTAVTASPV